MIADKRFFVANKYEIYNTQELLSSDIGIVYSDEGFEIVKSREGVLLIDFSVRDFEEVGRLIKINEMMRKFPE